MKSKQEIINCIKNSRLYHQATNSKAYFIFTPAYGVYATLNPTLAFCLMRNSRFMEGWYIEEELNSKAREIIQNQKTDISYIDKKVDECKKQMQELQAMFGSLSGFRFDKADYKEIIKILNKLDKLTYSLWYYVFICDYFDPKGEEFLHKEIENANLKLKRNELSILLHPKEINYAEKQRLELLKIALLIKNKKITLDSQKVKETLEKQAKEYYFIDNSWESTKILKPDNFMQKLQQILKDNSLEDIKFQISEITKDWLSEQEKIIRRYNIKSPLLNVIYLFRQIIFVRDERKKYVLLCNDIYDRCFKRISALKNIPFNTLAVALTSDFNKDINKDDYKKIFEQRKNMFLIIKYRKILTHLWGKDAEEIYGALHKSLSYRQDVIKGNIANKGKATGIARIIMGETHFGKFNENEILVAPMTRSTCH